MFSSALTLIGCFTLAFQEPKVAPPIDLGRAVPAEVWFYVQARDLDGLRANGMENALWKLFQDEALEPLRSQLEKSFVGTSKPEDSPMKLFDFLGSMHGSMTMFGTQPKSGEGIDFVVLFDPGTPRGGFEKLYDEVLEQESKDAITSTESYAGVELRVCEAKPNPAPTGKDVSASPDLKMNSIFFDAGTYAAVAVANDLDRVRELARTTIDRLQDKDVSDGIGKNARYVAARSSVGTPARLEAFADLERIIPFRMAKQPENDESTRRMVEHMGLAGLRWAYLAADLGAGESLRMDLSVGLPVKGALRTLFDVFGKLPREAARAFPKESVGLTLASLDVPKLTAWVLDLGKAAAPDSYEGARAQFEGAGQALGGIDIEKDILEQLTGEFGGNMIEVPEEEFRAANPELFELDAAEDEEPQGTADQKKLPAGTSVGQAFWIGLRDAKTFSSTLDNLLEATGLAEQIDAEDFQGRTIHTLGGEEPGALSFAFTSKGLVLSVFPSALRSALRMEGAKAEDTALERPSFKPVFAANPEAALFSVQQTAPSLKVVIGVMRTISQSFGAIAAMSGASSADALGSSVELLPGPEIIDKHLRGTMTSSLRRKGDVLLVELAMR